MIRRVLLATVRKELARLAADPAALLLWLGVPLVLGGLMTLAFGGADGPRPRARLLVVDQDGGLAAQLLLGALGAEQVPVDTEVVAEAEGRARIAAGDGSALLVLPPGLGRALLEETPTALELITNPQQRILPGIVEELFEMLGEAHFYAHRVLGEPVREVVGAVLEGGGEEPHGADLGPAQVAAVSAAIDATMRDVGGLLFPPAVARARPAPAAPAGTPDAAQDARRPLGLLLVPGMLVLALAFMAQGLAEQLWTEREAGTLARALAGPAPLGMTLAARLAAQVVPMTLVAGVALTAGALLYGVPLGRLPTALLAAALGAPLLSALFLLVATLASSRRAANVLGSLLLFPLVMLGGSFFPFAAMPAGLAAIGRCTPNGLVVDLLDAALRGDLGGARLLGSGALMLAVAAGLLALVHLRLGRGFARP